MHTCVLNRVVEDEQAGRAAPTITRSTCSLSSAEGNWSNVISRTRWAALITAWPFWTAIWLSYLKVHQSSDSEARRTGSQVTPRLCTFEVWGRRSGLPIVVTVRKFVVPSTGSVMLTTLLLTFCSDVTTVPLWLMLK